MELATVPVEELVRSLGHNLVLVRQAVVVLPIHVPVVVVRLWRQVALAVERVLQAPLQAPWLFLRVPYGLLGLISVRCCGQAEHDCCSLRLEHGSRQNGGQ